MVETDSETAATLTAPASVQISRKAYMLYVPWNTLAILLKFRSGDLDLVDLCHELFRNQTLRQFFMIFVGKGEKKNSLAFC